MHILQHGIAAIQTSVLLLTEIATAAPADSHLEIYRSLHEAMFAIGAVCALGAIAAVVDKYAGLLEAFGSFGTRIRFWPTFVALCIGAVLLALPEIHDYYDVSDLVTTDMKIEALQQDAILDILAAGRNNCKVYVAQYKMDQARILALRKLGNSDEADREAIASEHDVQSAGCKQEVDIGNESG